MRLFPLALGGALAGVLACAPTFTPRSVLEDSNPRILAVVQDPPEIAVDPLDPGPGPALDLIAFTWPQNLAEVGTWSFCPFSLGASVGYACIVPECEQPVPATVPGTALRAGVHPLDLTRRFLACVASSGAAPPAGLPSALPPTVEMLFRYVVDSGSAGRREAVQLFPVHSAAPGAGWEQNTLPGLASVAVGGVEVWSSGGTSAPAPGLSRSGGTLEICVDFQPGSAQTYLDPAGRPVRETLVVSFYTTAGRFDASRANGPHACVKLQAEELGAESQASLVVVGRDLRGGAVLPGCAGPATCAPQVFPVPIVP